MSACSYFYEGAEEGFYAYNKRGDLWRVPLIEPYEVVSPTNFEGLDDWFLIVDTDIIQTEAYLTFSEEEQFANLSSVAMSDSIIFVNLSRLYWPKEGGYFPSKLILDASKHELFVYPEEDSVNFLLKKQSLGINQTLHYYNWKVLKDTFLDSLKRPEEWVGDHPEWN